MLSIVGLRPSLIYWLLTLFKPIRHVCAGALGRVKPTPLVAPMASAHSLRTCTQHVNSTNPGRSNHCI